MTKKEVVESLSKKHGLPKLTTESLLNSFLSIVLNTLEKGEDISLRGFGRFTTKTQKAKKGYDFHSEETIVIAERKRPYLKFAKKINLG